LYSIRTYGIEPNLVNQMLNTLMDHLVLSENDPLDVHTVRTIAQFMIEKKNIIVNLLTFTSKYASVRKKKQQKKSIQVRYCYFRIIFFDMKQSMQLNL